MANSDNHEGKTLDPEEYYINTLPDIDVNGSYISGLANIEAATITSAYSEDFFINTGSVNWHISATPFVDTMPDLHRVHEMCEEYPSLAKAFENFKTMYAMVDQDWKGKNDE